MSDLPHLRLTASPNPVPYTYRGGGGGVFQRPPRDRAIHAENLRSELNATEDSAIELGLRESDPRPLAYELHPTARPVIDSLERSQSGIVLLNVKSNEQAIRVVVRVPAGKQKIISAILDRYANEEDSRSGRPKGQRLVESIDHIRLASREDLWTDNSPFPEADQEIWWEGKRAATTVLT